MVKVVTEKKGNCFFTLIRYEMFALTGLACHEIGMIIQVMKNGHPEKLTSKILTEFNAVAGFGK